MLEKVKMFLNIGRLLGKEKMFSCVKPEDAREIWLFLNQMNVNTNATNQGYCGDERAIKAYNLKRELMFYGWETIHSLEYYCRDLYFKNKE